MFLRQIECDVVVKEHFSGTYELVIHNKIKTFYRSELIIPESNYYKEEVTIRLIDINDRGRATNEFEELYKRVDIVNIASNVNIQNQPAMLSVETGNPTAGNSPLYLYITYRIVTL